MHCVSVWTWKAIIYCAHNQTNNENTKFKDEARRVQSTTRHTEPWTQKLYTGTAKKKKKVALNVGAITRSLYSGRCNLFIINVQRHA